jgi:hypothetical protein
MALRSKSPPDRTLTRRETGSDAKASESSSPRKPEGRGWVGGTPETQYKASDRA